MNKIELRVEVPMLNKLDANCKLVAIATQVGNDVHCNIGKIINGEFKPLIDPKVWEGTSLGIHHLFKEIGRLEREKMTDIESDSRLRMAISNIRTNVLRLLN